MRDIRDDLKERLAGIEARRASIRKALAETDDERTAILKLLEFENRRHTAPPRSNGLLSSLGSLAAAAAAVYSLPTYIEHALENRPLSKDEIKELTEKAGYFKGEESAGRVLHATLMNMERNGRVRVREDGKYEKAPNQQDQELLVTS